MAISVTYPPWSLARSLSVALSAGSFFSSAAAADMAHIVGPRAHTVSMKSAVGADGLGLRRFVRKSLAAEKAVQATWHGPSVSVAVVPHAVFADSAYPGWRERDRFVLEALLWAVPRWTGAGLGGITGSGRGSGGAGHVVGASSSSAAHVLALGRLK
jgi:hypothetical protein